MKRTLLLGTAWTASAAAAVGLGFLATSLVGASASPGTVPAGAAATGPDDTATASSAPITTPSGTQATVAGIVSASCESGSPQLSGAPAAGWWLDDSQDPGEVQFENGTQKLEVHVACIDGSPRFSVEGPRADDSGGDDGPSSAPARGPSSSPSSPAGVTDAPDDSDGRIGGGHGSDDPPGDDNGGDGRGYDDSGGDDSGGDDSGKGRGRGSDD
jgi:hypothetical protein